MSAPRREPILLALMRRAAWPPALVFAFHLLAFLALGLYERFPSLDRPMHFVGGLAIAHFWARGLELLEERQLVEHVARPLRAVLVSSLVTVAAVLWEFAEFLADRLLALGLQAGQADTMLDLALGMAGGLAFVALDRGRRT